jgi:tRNA(Arg) A34 adenosine deaminase TadA
VHSRIRRVYFINCVKGQGALATHLHIHQMRQLNHRYRVFQVTFPSEFSAESS